MNLSFLKPRTRDVVTLAIAALFVFGKGAAAEEKVRTIAKDEAAQAVRPVEQQTKADRELLEARLNDIIRRLDRIERGLDRR